MKLGAAIILIYCFVVVCSQVTTELQQKLRAREDECIGDHDVLYTLERIDQVRQTRKLPEDQSLDAFAICMLENYYSDWLESNATLETSHPDDCFSKNEAIEEDTQKKIFECQLESNVDVIDYTPRIRTMKPRSLF